VRKDRLGLLQGTLDMLVMKTLAGGPLHGYNIVDRLRTMSSDIIRVEEGSLYPALHRMENRGWIESEWGTSENNRKAKYYRLTRAGRKQLQTERTQWSQLSQAITGIMEAG
jgi:PadR family transcriptional regulator, regulatory protein PadR